MNVAPRFRYRLTATLSLATVVATSGAWFPAPPATADGPTTTITTTGTSSYTVPEGVYAVVVEVWGAAGSGGEHYAGVGGSGGGARATLAVTPGQHLQVTVGAIGGGGSGGPNNYYDAGGGGGATDIRVGACAADLSCGLSDRVVVAGGGGGAGGFAYPSSNGYCGGGGGANADGSGSNGCDGKSSYPHVHGGGRGGGTGSGGLGGTGYEESRSAPNAGGNGVAGDGGNGGGTSDNDGPGGGGGDGWYGGGGGGGGFYSGAGGGGGSSHITGDALNSEFLGASNRGHGTVSIVHAATQIDIQQSATGSLAHQSTRVLTATLKDSAGNTVSTGPDSVLSVTFSRADGTGNLTGLGTTTAVNGVATLTVTGSTVGDLSVDAEAGSLTSDALSMTVVKGSQAITFSAPTSPATYGSAFNVAPSSSSGLAVTVAASGACTASASGGGWAVTMTSGTGTCTLTASQAGNTSWNPATSVEHTVTAGKSSQVSLAASAPASAAYGESVTVTVSGGSSGETPEFSAGTGCSVTASDTSSATVRIEKSSGTCSVSVTRPGNDNWSTVSTSASISAVKRSLSVVAVATEAEYGEDDPTLLWSLDGFVLGDDATATSGAASCSRTPGTGVGQYTVTCSPGTLSATDYSFATGATAKHTVTKRTVTVTASDETMAFGDEVPAISAGLANLAYGETSLDTAPTCSTSATSASDTGTYATSCSGAADSDYDFDYVSGTLTVEKADQSVTFVQPDSPATYGGQFAIAPTASSDLAVNVEADGGCTLAADGDGWTVTMTSGIVACELTATQAGDGNWNPAAGVTRTVSAAKAGQVSLGVSSPGSAVYGTTFDVTVSGGSGTGAYSVSASGGCALASGGTGATASIRMTSGSTDCSVTAERAGDDDHQSVDSTVVVEAVKAVAAVDAVDSSARFGEAEPTFTWVITGLLTGDDPSVVSGSAACSRAIGSTPGGYAITCGPGSLAADDYSFVTGDAAVHTIDRGVQTVTFAAPVATLGYLETTTVAPVASSGLPVTVDADGPCSVDPSGPRWTVVITDVAGTCALRATQAGDGNWTPAEPVTRRITATEAVVPDGPRSGAQEPGKGTMVLADGTVLEFETERDESGNFVVAVGSLRLQLPAAGEEPGFVPGETTVFEGSGYFPGSTVDLTLFSSPRKLGSVEADADGHFRAEIALPDDIPAGAHTLQISGIDEDGNPAVVEMGVTAVSPGTEEPGAGVDGAPNDGGTEGSAESGSGETGDDSGWPAGLNVLLRLVVVFAVGAAVARWRLRRSR